MKLIAKQRNFLPQDIAAAESDIDSERVKLMIIGLTLDQLNVAEACKSPVCFIHGDTCAALDVGSLHVLLAACTLQMEIPVWEIDIDAFKILVEFGGDFRKEIEVDGKPIYQYLGFTEEQVNAEGAEPPNYGPLLEALVNPPQDTVEL